MREPACPGGGGERPCVALFGGAGGREGGLVRSAGVWRPGSYRTSACCRCSLAISAPRPHQEKSYATESIRTGCKKMVFILKSKTDQDGRSNRRERCLYLILQLLEFETFIYFSCPTASKTTVNNRTVEFEQPASHDLLINHIREKRGFGRSSSSQVLFQVAVRSAQRGERETKPVYGRRLGLKNRGGRGGGRACVASVRACGVTGGPGGACRDCGYAL